MVCSGDVGMGDVGAILSGLHVGLGKEDTDLFVDH